MTDWVQVRTEYYQQEDGTYMQRQLVDGKLIAENPCWTWHGLPPSFEIVLEQFPWERNNNERIPEQRSNRLLIARS